MCIKKAQATEQKATHRMRENILKHLPEKGLISRIYKEVLQLNNKKCTD